MKQFKTNRTIMMASILASLSFGAMAETPSFNFVEVGYTELDIDGKSVEPDGVEFDFNYELSDNLYMSADYTKASKSNFDTKITNIGLGYKSDISSDSTFFTQLDWAKYDTGISDDDGYKASIGFRSNLTKRLEVTAAYEYLDIKDKSNNFYVLGAAYQLNDKFAVYGDYKHESDFDQMSLGVRMTF